VNNAGGGISAEGRVLLQEAAEWRLISLLFECPTGPWRDRVGLLETDVHDALLRQTAGEAMAEASEGMFHSLFGPGGPVPAREVAYRGEVDPGQLLSSIAAYYQAFAYRPETMEADDHISIETGFIAYLKVKAAYALNCGDPGHQAVASEAARTFIEEHLATWIVPMAAALEAAAPPYLAGAGELLQSRLRAAGFIKEAEQG
jgi:TorA maturation chaperone TorD